MVIHPIQPPIHVSSVYVRRFEVQFAEFDLHSSQGNVVTNLSVSLIMFNYKRGFPEIERLSIFAKRIGPQPDKRSQGGLVHEKKKSKGN